MSGIVVEDFEEELHGCAWAVKRAFHSFLTRNARSNFPRVSCSSDLTITPNALQRHWVTLKGGRLCYKGRDCDDHHLLIHNYYCNQIGSSAQCWWRSIYTYCIRERQCRVKVKDMRWNVVSPSRRSHWMYSFWKLTKKNIRLCPVIYNNGFVPPAILNQKQSGQLLGVKEEIQYILGILRLLADRFLNI